MNLKSKLFVAASLALALGVGFAGLSQAQQAPAVQESASHLRAATLVQTASGTAQQTITITPPSGLYVYIVGMELSEQAVTAPAASAVTWTSTNLGGAKWYNGLTATAGVDAVNTFYPATPLKSAAAGTATTIVSNAAITNVTYSATVFYYFAP